MRTVEVQEAKTHLSALLAEVERGATIAIARGPRTIAHLVPADSNERELGFGGYRLPDSFFDELPEEEVGARERTLPSVRQVLTADSSVRKRLA